MTQRPDVSTDIKETKTGRARYYLDMKSQWTFQWPWKGNILLQNVCATVIKGTRNKLFDSMSHRYWVHAI